MYGLDYRVQTSAGFVKFLLGSIPPHFLSPTLPLVPPLTSVSYTHLTLPTIYSV